MSRPSSSSSSSLFDADPDDFSALDELLSSSLRVTLATCSVISSVFLSLLSALVAVVVVVVVVVVASVAAASVDGACTAGGVSAWDLSDTCCCCWDASVARASLGN